jgi:hypothetical protein
MPQFDSITFFNDLFWLLFLFFIFYFLLLKNILPSVSSILKARTKKSAKSNAFLILLQEENTKAILVTAIFLKRVSFF